MIGKLRGRVDEIKPTELVLDVNGVGYHLHIPIKTYESIHHEKNEISLYVYTYHKEDQFKLYGFHDEESKSLFSILIGMSGIGPAMALSILSGITIERLIESVKRETTSYLVKIPGIGKTKAEKLIFELKRKMKKLEGFNIQASAAPSVKSDAIDALISLGFDEARSTRIIDQIYSDNPEMSVEAIIKEALKILSG